MARLYAFLLLLLPGLIMAQSAEEQPAFYTGVSPLVLSDRSVEITLNNNLSSFWIAISEFNPSDNSSRVADRFRFTSIDHLLRVSYGFSRSGRWDLGLEAGYTHRRLDEEARSSPFRALGADEETAVLQAAGFSQLGLRLRMLPFSRLPELTLQATYHIPGSRDEEEAKRLGFNQPQAGLGLNFYQRLNPYTFYFVQADWRSRLSNGKTDRTTHLPGASGFLVFDLTGNQQWYVFPGLSYQVSLQQSGGELRRINQQLYGTLGLLFQPGGRFGLLLNSQLPFLLDSGQSQIEWVRESYSGFTLGLRYWM